MNLISSRKLARSQLFTIIFDNNLHFREQFFFESIVYLLVEIPIAIVFGINFIRIFTLDRTTHRHLLVFTFILHATAIA